MANPEHLEILKSGVKEWNSWRAENQGIIPDLSEQRIENEDLGRHISIKINSTGTSLEYAEAVFPNFRNVNFRKAYLAHVRLSGSGLVGANFNGAQLYGVDFVAADLRRANFWGAHLYGVNFFGALLEGADFAEANLEQGSFGDNDLSGVKNLHSVKHRGASSLGVETIYKSRGNIHEVFLRGCGIPESFITRMHSLTDDSPEFYKCFISFTEADDVFSERLYNDLQANGVRCWRWKEDARWGKTLMSSIDDAVKQYDKLIVVCSEQSLNSPAVIREIERALQKEDDLARRAEDGEVLFPIRLDDYIFTGWDQHRKADVVAKNVGDFRRWTDYDSYRKALGRLLRDLRAGE
jgi:uncharacterized protein YjbI with pentapeptide repeats